MLFRGIMCREHDDNLVGVFCRNRIQDLCAGDLWKHQIQQHDGMSLGTPEFQRRSTVMRKIDAIVFL